MNKLAFEIHAANVAAGWYPEEDRKNPYQIPMKLALVHSEISEALEGFRKNLQDDKLPHRSSLEVELADAFIRLLDIVGYLNLDIDGAIQEKLAYNKVRADHKQEARASVNGKKF